MPYEFDDCLVLNTVMAARSLTRRYDAKLRPFGVSVVQFVIMNAVKNAEDAPVSAIAQRIAMDRTTLLRNLELMQRKDLVQSRVAQKRNGRIFELTPAGAALLVQLIPEWQKAQDELMDVLKATDTGGLLAAMRLLTAG